MEKIVCSALVQEAVSRGVSFGLRSLSRREEKASQGHLLERLQMAVSQLEFAVERAQELRIRHLSLISQRKQIRSAYVEAMELLNKHKQQQEVPAGQELQVAQGVKRKRWNFWSKDMPLTASASLSASVVRRFELYADCAHKFVRDVESGCSLHHYTFCNTIVRHLLEGKTLSYCNLEQGKVLRDFYIWPVYSDERGVEAVLNYQYGDSTMNEQYFFLLLYLRLSESTDIVGVAIKGFQLLASEFKLPAEFATGELSMLSNLQDIAHSYEPPLVVTQEYYINYTKPFRPDRACCKGSRHGLCANSNISSELSGRLPEQVILWGFQCYYVPAIEPSSSSCSSFDGVGRSKSRGGVKPPLLLTAAFLPHDVNGVEDSYAVKTIGDDKVYIDASIQQVAEVLHSDAIRCLMRQPEQTKCDVIWRSKHGSAHFLVEKAITERAGAQCTANQNVQYPRKYK